jgi:hypothetical protein
MKKQFSIAIACISISIASQAQTVTTTTITGNLKVSDSLHVVNNITTAGDVKATGEVVAKDTMRAQKDILIDGNAVVGGNMKVAGTTSVSDLNITGSVNISSQPATINPCLQLLMTETSPTNTQHLVSLDAAAIGVIEANLDANPCPTPPVIPFTWNTYGNHVNSNNRWIGTIENFDFNIRTNNILRMSVKNNGQIFFGTKHIQASHLHANSGFQFDGKLACKELVVVDPTKWADFVFDNNYKLLPLAEVEHFYNTNKHLPSVPSEQEVKTNGINTAEMDAILLQKIEELTLYIVQQQKEIDALKKEIKK